MSAAAVISRKVRRRFTAEEYLLLERQADSKNEFFDGDIFAMAGASAEHNFITANLISSLTPRLRAAGCRVLASDQRVATSMGNYFYPDVSAVCGQPRFADRQRDTLVNPVLIVEVLSKSTQQFDRLIKLPEYQLIPSVRDILLVSQDRCRVEHYFRKPRKPWESQTQSRMAGAIAIASLTSQLTLAEIYSGVEFA